MVKLKKGYPKRTKHGWVFTTTEKFRVPNREDQDDEATGIFVHENMARVNIDYAGMEGRNPLSFQIPTDSALLRAMARIFDKIAAQNDPSD